MSSYQRGLILCRSGRQVSKRSNALSWSTPTSRRWLSTEQSTITQDNVTKGEAFDKLMSRLEQQYSDSPQEDTKKAPRRNVQPSTQKPPRWLSEDKPDPPRKTSWNDDSGETVKSNQTAEQLESQSIPFQSSPIEASLNPSGPLVLSDSHSELAATPPSKIRGKSTGKAPTSDRKAKDDSNLKFTTKTEQSFDNGKQAREAEYKSVGAVRIKFANGKARSYDPLFLRDCCTCPKCVDQSTRQKLFSTTDISANIRAKKMWSEGDVLNIRWANDLPNFGDDHVTSIPHGFLFRSVRKPPVKQYRAGKQLWTAEQFEKDQITFDYPAYMSDDKVFFRALRQLHRYGLVFVKNVPEKEASVSDIATRIGPLKSTFYGNTWDVRSVAEAKNVAYTSQDLGFHMDLLYMHQPPRIQLLHCLKASTEGGTSLFSDSYLAAEKLFQHDKPSFDALVDNDVNFHYDNDSQHYHQSRRVIQLADGKRLDETKSSVHSVIDAVNWSPPFQGPFHNISSDHGLISQVRAWHRAAQAFRDLVEAKSAVYQRQMPPGECVIFDNRRVLHARTAFSGGERWLRGCYLDSDPLLSKMRVLERQHGDVTSRYGS